MVVAEAGAAERRRTAAVARGVDVAAEITAFRVDGFGWRGLVGGVRFG
jgi:hypothetical protein